MATFSRKILRIHYNIIPPVNLRSLNWSILLHFSTEITRFLLCAPSYITAIKTRRETYKLQTSSLYTIHQPFVSYSLFIPNIVLSSPFAKPLSILSLKFIKNTADLRSTVFKPFIWFRDNAITTVLNNISLVKEDNMEGVYLLYKLWSAHWRTNSVCSP